MWPHPMRALMGAARTGGRKIKNMVGLLSFPKCPERKAVGRAVVLKPDNHVIRWPIKIERIIG